MNCPQARLLVDAYADGELDPAGVLQMEQHFRDCPACAQAFRNVQNLRKSLKPEALRFTAPAEWRNKLESEWRSQVERSPGQNENSRIQEGLVTPRRDFFKFAFLFLNSAAAVCLALLISFALARPSSQQQLAQEIVSSHIRSLMANHEMDVASSDQHTVKPWFDGKLDFSPPVKDLAAQGFPLIGGRLDYLNNRAVAALVFHRAKHVINLFVWPSSEADSEAGARPSINGYNLIHWSRAGMTFWAVSDLNEKELMEFARGLGTN
jgi:anti-sigma factor RsiW